MRKVLGSVLPPIVHTVDVRDWNLREILFRNSFQTADVDAVHLSDRRVIADSKWTHTASLAEEVLILLGIEQVLSEHLPA